MSEKPSRQDIKKLIVELGGNTAMNMKRKFGTLRSQPTDTFKTKVLQLLGGGETALANRIDSWFEKGANLGKRQIYENRTWGVKKMKIQDTVERHQKRMLRLFYEINNTFRDIDKEKLAFQLRFHDVEEMTGGGIGDIPTPAKEKMSTESKKTLDKIVQLIITLRAPECAKRFGYTGDSVGALMEIGDKKTKEVKILKWFDYLDAYMITLREISLHEVKLEQSDKEDRELLNRRKKKYKERMIEFIKNNPGIFTLSESDYFNVDIWHKNFRGEGDENFKLYQDWSKATKGM